MTTVSPPDKWEMLPIGAYGTWGTDANLIELTRDDFTAVADAGGGDITVTSSGHGLVVGQYVRIEGTTNYDGEYVVQAVTTDTFDVTATYVSTETGTWDSNLIGDTYVRLENTTPGSGNGMMYKDFIPVETGGVYAFSCTAMATSVAAGRNVFCGIYWYESDKSTIVSASYANTGVLSAIGTWYDLAGIYEAPGRAKFAKPLFGKGNQAFYAFIDKIDFKRFPTCCLVTKSAAQNIAANTPTTIAYDNEAYDYGDNFDASSTYRFVAPATGLYSVSAQVVTTTDPGSTQSAYLYLNHNGTNIQFDKDYFLNGSSYNTLAGSTTLLMTRGQYLEIVYYHFAGGTWGVTTGSGTRLAVARVE